MIQSMTGYAAASGETERGALVLELRSVNARFLDLQFRVMDELRALEPALREIVAARVSRGKVDCRVFVNEERRGAPRAAVNREALAALQALAAQVTQALPQATPLRVADALRWPGVLAESSLDAGETRALAERLCRQALDELVAARAREGAKLADAIGARLGEMTHRLDAVAPLLPQAIAAYQARLAERLREAIGASLDDERVRVEVALFAAKSDVDEELTRLRAHISEAQRTLAKGGAVGKRLDFVAQELNREANTLASKAASQDISDCALELKLLVEQIREQVQNLE